MPTELILASSSPRRVELLQQAGYPFRSVQPQVEEWEDPAADPSEMVLENAGRKARAVSGQFPDALVLGADTTVALDRCVLNKPVDREDALRMLKFLNGRTHEVLTGLVLIGPEGSESWIETSRVTFKQLDETELQTYLDSIHPYDKAGAYAIQDGGDRIISRYEGAMETIMGLPLLQLKKRLEARLGPGPILS